MCGKIEAEVLEEVLGDGSYSDYDVKVNVKRAIRLTIKKLRENNFYLGQIDVGEFNEQKY